MEIVKCGNIKILVSEKLKGVKHGFTLRNGGVSEGDFGSLNLGLRRGDNPFKALRNIEICTDEMGLNKERLTLTYQLHTKNVRFLKEEDIGKGLIREWGEGVDGVVTDMLHTPIMTYSADCVPTLLYDGVRKMIGAVHGGWRGTKENIIAEAVRVMAENGCERENIIALIGPAIGICCYEVSGDVGEAFCEKYPTMVKRMPNDKYMVDLKGITACQLREAGLKKENIENSNICTACENESFFSHRAQKGRSGLLGGFIQLD
ncbi:MAG: peptidoglycan editing factor PgeF [Clostridia bacterium]|nr:peptidoglycan editing factor PgeF [Clostridia bacterium]